MVNLINDIVIAITTEFMFDTVGFSLGDLQTALRQCFISFRATPFDPGSEEFKLLELYIMSRSNGLRIETPAVRY